VSAQRALSRLSVLLLVVFAVVAPTPATAGATWTTGPCKSLEGVTVAVDLTGAGRSELIVRCAPGNPGNARTALEQAGLAVHSGDQVGAYDERNYVCRIEGLPTAKTDTCAGHQDGKPFWKVWRVGIDPISWRGTLTDGGPSALRTCPGGLVGFSHGVGTRQQPNVMTTAPDHIITTPGWLPPTC
jgi:hypothetical protein